METDKVSENLAKASKVMKKVTLLQMLLLTISCSIGVYLTCKGLVYEQLWIVVFHLVGSCAIVELNKKWIDAIK